MTSEQIAELRRLLDVEPGPYHPDIDGPRHAAAWRALPKLLDEREALYRALKYVAIGRPSISEIRAAIAKAESP